MAYIDLADLSDNEAFRRRCAAAYSTQGITPTVDALGWVVARRWRLAASPGFSDAYASAVAGGVENPGEDPAVIPDSDILSAVQAVIAEGDPA